MRKEAQRNLNKPSVKAHLQAQKHPFLDSSVLNHVFTLQNINPYWLDTEKKNRRKIKITWKG